MDCVSCWMLVKKMCDVVVMDNQRDQKIQNFLSISYLICFGLILSGMDFGSDFLAGINYVYLNPTQNSSSIWAIITFLFIWIPGIMLGIEWFWTLTLNYLQIKLVNRTNIDAETHVLMSIKVQVNIS